MPLVCLIGRHGSGKSTVGAALAARGYTHISVGLLRRLAVANQFPSDVPVTLMMAMRRARPGMPLAPDIVGKLLKFMSGIPDCVVDGFPASIEHIDLLPLDARIALVWSPKAVREDRLMRRAETTKRQWIVGCGSERERVMGALVRKARSRGSVLFLPNTEDGDTGIAALAARITSKVSL